MDNSCAVLSLQIVQIQQEVRFMVTIFNCAISLISMVVNALTILSVYTYKGLWSKSNLILCVLAAVDFATGVASEPMFIVDFFQIGNLEMECILDNIRIFLSTFLFAMSMCTLTLISYDRYLHMTLLNNYDLRMTNKRIWALILFYSTWSIIVASIRLLKDTLGRTLAKILFIATLVVLATLIFKFYIKIYKINLHSLLRVGQRGAPNRAEDESNEPTDSQQTRRVRSKGLLNTFFVISLCLLICWLPMFAFLCTLTMYEIIYGSFKDSNLPLNVLFLIAWTAGNLKSALNPSVYIYRNRELKSHIARFCKEKILRAKPIVPATTEGNETDTS